MGCPSTPPKTALALAGYLAGHPLVWICGLPGGGLAASVSRIDGDVIELVSLAGGRTRRIVLPAGWNCRKKWPPVRTQAIRDAFRFHEGGFSVSCVERRNRGEILHIHVRYLDERRPFS